MPRRAKQPIAGPLAPPQPVATPLLLLYSRQQAASAISVSLSTFDALAKTVPTLRPVKVKSRPRWPYKNLLAYVEELVDAAENVDQWADVRP
jgi:hypothetical protein